MSQHLTQLRTEPFAAERTWEVEGIPVLSASVSLPQPVPAADRVSRRIRRYYQGQCRAFLRYCEKTLLPQAAAEYRAALASSAPLPHRGPLRILASLGLLQASPCTVLPHCPLEPHPYPVSLLHLS